MRYVFAVTLSFFFLSGLCTPSHAEDDFDTALAKGAWALQFAIGEDFTLSNFAGSTIALKRFTGDRVAWSLGLTGSFDVDDLDQETSNAAQEDEVVDGESTTWDIGFTLVRLHYLEPSGRMHFHWGAGPTFSLRHDDSPSSRVGTIVSGTELVEERAEFRNELETWRVGGVAVVGSEWFATRTISLHADYRLSLTYASSEIAQESSIERSDGYSRQTRRVSDRQTWRLAGSSVRFGLSAYF